MKSELRARQNALESLWQQGLSGRMLLREHTRLVDTHIAHNFEKCLDAKNGMALVAVGGYGRKELFPFSDIDLLLLYEPNVENKLTPAVEAVFYPLWDAGLEVGHAVRTLDACLEHGKKDFFFQVAMLDARLLTGSIDLFNQLVNSFQHSFVEGQRREFLNNMLKHRKRRHKSFGMQNYLLEPHIKESRGGLRDIQAMIWTAQVIFGLHGLSSMENAGLLNDSERRRFDSACDELIRIRNGLHFVSGRKNDQLYFEHQEEIAKLFDYKPSKGLLGVEHFMRNVYGHMKTVAVTTDFFFEHVDEVLGITLPTVKDRKLEKGIEIRHGRIHLTDPGLAEKKVYLLMRLFAWAADTGLPIHHRTLRLVNDRLLLLNDKVRCSRRMANAFFEVLKKTGERPTVLEAMLESGLLSAYIPEFADLESLSQHDVYHVYTVDSHLLQTVAELNRLRKEEPNIFSIVPSPEILFLAGLLHDIGKGKGGDHSKLGAELVGPIGKRLGLKKDEIQTIIFLVREHLFLAHMSMRRDLGDDAFIRRCSEKIASPDRLAMLYLLTIADSKATGPTVWNEWKGALLLEFYLKTVQYLDTDRNNVDTSRKMEWKRAKLADLMGNNKVFDLKSLPDDYLLSFTPEEAYSHIRYRKELGEKKLLVNSTDLGGKWSLLIMAKDRRGLLARICGTLALHNLEVRSAQIFTWADGTAVDVIDVISVVSIEYEDQDWEAFEKDLHLAVNLRLGLDYRLGRKTAPMKKSPHCLNHATEDRVVIDNETSDTYTIIEIFSKDRFELLYRITKTLADFGINIFRAIIGCKADQIVDVFYGLDDDGRKVINPDFQEEIRRGLLYAVKDVSKK